MPEKPVRKARVMNALLSGILIPAVTVFDADERVDRAAMEFNFDRWGRTDVAGYMVLGSNGEFRMLTDEESREVVATAACAKSGKTLIVGAGRESLAHTLAFMRSLEPWYVSIDYLSVLTPSYFAKLMDGPALRDYYTTLADASPVPLLLYVAPSFANGVVVPPAVLAELADHPNIAGIKDTSPTMMVDYMLAAGGREHFVVLAGSLANMMSDLSFGGTGGVVSAANYLPAECATLTTLYLGGREREAYAYYATLQRLAKATGGKYSVASLKACMNARGYRAGVPRRPVRPLSDEQDAAARAALEAGLAELHAVSSPFSPPAR